MKYLISCLLTLAVSLPAPAQQVKPAPRRTVTPAKVGAPHYSESIINPMATSLPPGYLGHDAKKIYRALEERQKPKGEFETTQAYQDRIASDLARPLVGSLKLTDNLFAFELSPIISEYDADQGRLLIGVELRDVMRGVTPDPSLKGLGLMTNGDSLRETYTGTNAYGAKVEVEKHVFTVYEIAIHNWQEWKTSDYLPTYARDNPLTAKYSIKPAYTFTLKLSPAEAKASKAELKVLAICRIAEPFISNGGSSMRPTIERPRDTTMLNKNIHVELVVLWVFNGRTGEVVAKRIK